MAPIDMDDQDREPLTALEAALLVVIYTASGAVASLYLVAAWQWFFA